MKEKIKEQLIIGYEKLTNWILCLIFKIRIKANWFNRDIDKYINGRELTFNENFNGNKINEPSIKMEGACYGYFMKDSKMLISEKVYSIENNIMKFKINPDNGLYNNWESNYKPEPYIFNTAYFNTNTGEKKFLQTYGRFEIKCKLGTTGNWSAFWLLSQRFIDGLSPILPEIDIFEQNEKGGLVFTAHYGTDYNTKDKIMEQSFINGIDFSKDFWLISIEWTNKDIRWYLNNHLVKVSRFSKILKKHQPHYPSFLIFNENLFNNVKVEVRKGMEVDFIRVYK